MEITNKISQIKRAPPPDLSTHRNPGSATSAQDKVCLAQARRLYVWSAYLTYVSLQLFQKGINLQARLLTSGVVEQLHR